MRQQDIPVLETYAEALLDAARGRGEVDAVFAEAGLLRGILAANPGLLRLMEKPAIEKEEKKTLLRRVFDGRLSPLMTHLPLLLVDKYRGGLWGDILEFFITKVERERGIRYAQIATARILSSGEKDLLKTCLEKFTGKQLRIHYHETPDLLGGVLFRCEDILIDTTLSSALHGLGRRLRAVKL
jgi:F-type H+-transporting ATPase subunit delta